MQATTTGNRAYSIVLTERTFGNATHCYALVGLEGKTWNLLGGKQENSDRTRGITAARELFEESGMVFDKRGDKKYWEHLSTYEWGKHKVFIHKPGNLPITIAKLNLAAKNALNNPNLPRDYKEMSKYELINLSDLVALANTQQTNGQPLIYDHPTAGKMAIDGWLLYTLKNANLSHLTKYNY